MSLDRQHSNGIETYEPYELPGLKVVDGVAEIVGNYPGKGGKGELAAWSKDSEGNVLDLGQPLR